MMYFAKMGRRLLNELHTSLTHSIIVFDYILSIVVVYYESGTSITAVWCSAQYYTQSVFYSPFDRLSAIASFWPFVHSMALAASKQLAFSMKSGSKGCYWWKTWNDMSDIAAWTSHKLGNVERAMMMMLILWQSTLSTLRLT